MSFYAPDIEMVLSENGITMVAFMQIASVLTATRPLSSHWTNREIVD